MANFTNSQALETLGVTCPCSSSLPLPWVGGLACVKQLREYVSDTVLSILQRGATAEDMGQGLFWDDPIGSCSVTSGVQAQQWGKMGLPSGHGEQQDCSLPRGLLAPRVR